MKRRILILLLIMVLAFIIGYTAREAGALETFLPKETTANFVATPIETSASYPHFEEATTRSTLYDFISFSGKHLLDIKPILQMPEFPTGCESVSLAMALSYVTMTNVEPADIVDHYLPISKTNGFVATFFGDPRSEGGGGCYPPAIITAANDYFKDSEINLYALDATGINAEQIKHYIENGFPVIIWTTMYMCEPHFRNQFEEYNGQKYQWYTSEHCVLIKGYNPEKNVFIINDPLIGEVERDIDEFMEISDKIGNLAVIIL